MRRRAPQPIAIALAQLTERVQPLTKLAQVQRAWGEAVGPVIAGWGKPLSEKSGVVTIGCRDSITAHELDLQKTQILAKLAEDLGADFVTDLRFRVG